MSKERTPAQKAHDAEFGLMMKEKAAQRKASAQETEWHGGSSSQKSSYKKKEPGLYKQKSAPKSLGKTKTTAVASAYSIGQGGHRPKYHFHTADGVRLSHRELVVPSVTNGSSQSAFAVGSTLALNPGIAATFPWLSVQAQGYEQYRFNKLKFCYYARCATSTAGSIMLVPDYDAADAAPYNEVTASAYKDVQEEVVWIPEMCCELDVKSMHPDGRRKFTRTGALAANLDIKTYDVGTMFVCTNDQPSTNIAFGKVWVEYDITFFTPQLPPNGPLSINGALYTGGGSLSGAKPFGASPVASGTPTNVVVFGTGSNSQISFSQPGIYFMAYTIVGTVLSAFVVSGSTWTADSTVVDSGALALSGYGHFNITVAGSTYNLSCTATTVTSSSIEIGTTTAAIV